MRAECVKDKGSFYNLISQGWFVPKQYLYSSIIIRRAASFIYSPQDLKIELSKIVDAASKVCLSLKRVDKFKLIEEKCNKEMSGI